MHPITLDRFGLSLSGLCAVHCLLLPALLAVLPFAATTHVLHAWVHPALVLLVAPVGVQAIRHGLRDHGSLCVAVWITIGLVLVLGALPWHFLFGLHGERILTLTGSACLAAGHWANSRRSIHTPPT